MNIQYGIPEPTDSLQNEEVRFLERTSAVYFHKFPKGILPSGGLSGRISPSEMMMVTAGEIVRFTWINPTGKTIATGNGTYSFIGKYPWEVRTRGYYTCLINDSDYGKVVFEVL